MKFIHAALLAVFALAASAAQALTVSPYSPAAVAKAMESGDPIALQFHAGWCPTCRAQTKAFEQLKADSSLNLTLFVVDYDTETKLKQQLKVREQSTVIVYRGSQERSRAVGTTQAEQLGTLLRSALK